MNTEPQSQTQFTRADYMAKQCTHRKFYAQFVTPYVRKLVVDRIGAETISKSKDEHFNDIPLTKWDAIWVHSDSRGMWIEPGASLSKLIRATGENLSASTGACILKEAAKQIKEGVQP